MDETALVINTCARFNKKNNKWILIKIRKLNETNLKYIHIFFSSFLLIKQYTATYRDEKNI